MSQGKLLFLATEDWFFRTHFLPLARRAREDGYDVVIATRNTGALEGIEGFRLVSHQFERGALLPWQIGRQIAEFSALLSQERPTLVHAIGLKSIVLLLLTGARDFGRVLAVTGQGYFATGRALWRALARMRVRSLLRSAMDQPRTVLLVENAADASWIEGRRALRPERVVFIPGAGVNPQAFTTAPEPDGEEVVVGFTGRLIRSKGIDLAVEAVRRLRAEGLSISLRVAGGPDPENPEHFTAVELDRFRATPGVTLTGHVDDINAFWAACHISCVPSRGGEGLPRVLLEAAACGRPNVTSNTPGCIDFVRDGETGFVVPREDVAALTDALRRLASDRALRHAMGGAGRARIINGYTEAHAAAAAALAWQRARG